MEGNEFKNKRILVTGGSRGIGKAICISLSKLGAKVTTIGRNEVLLSQLISEYPSIESLILDCSDIPSILSAIKDRVFDGLVNNVGIIITQDFLTTTLPSYEKVMDVNLKAAFFIGQVVAKNMIRDGINNGSIVNISSIASSRHLPLAAAYSLSKAGMDSLTKTMAVELGYYSIRVNSVNPGVVETDMLTSRVEDMSRMGLDLGKVFGNIINSIPYKGKDGSGNVGMDCVTSTVEFLLSDRSGSITGQSIFVDKGLTAS